MANKCGCCGASMGGLLGIPRSKGDPTICTACYWQHKNQATLDPARQAEQAELERRTKLRRDADQLAKSIQISTTSMIHGREITGHLGIARGGTVRAKNAISDFGAGIKNLVGGEVKGYTQLLADAREQAIHRMKVDAVMMGADAVVGVNFSTSMIDVGAAEIAAFGTAITLSPEANDD